MAVIADDIGQELRPDLVDEGDPAVLVVVRDELGDRLFPDAGTELGDRQRRTSWGRGTGPWASRPGAGRTAGAIPARPPGRPSRASRIWSSMRVTWWTSPADVSFAPWTKKRTPLGVGGSAGDGVDGLDDDAGRRAGRDAAARAVTGATMTAACAAGQPVPHATTVAVVASSHDAAGRARPTRTATTRASCVRIGGGPPRIPRRTSCPTCAPGCRCSTSARAPGRSPSTLPSGWDRAASSGSTRPRRSLAAARADAAAAGVDNVEFLVGDAYALPFADGSFDVVHAHQVLQHLGDPVAGAARDGAASPARAGWSPPATATTARCAGTRPSRCSTAGWRSTARSTSPTAASPTRDAGSSPGRTRPGFTRRPPVGDDLVLRDPGGSCLVGRPVGRPHVEVGVRGSGGRHGLRDAAMSCRRSPMRGAAGRTSPTAGSSCRVGRSDADRRPDHGSRTCATSAMSRRSTSGARPSRRG